MIRYHNIALPLWLVVIVSISFFPFCCASGAMATHSCFVIFTSDTGPDKDVVLPSFNTMGGYRILTDVLVELFHNGYCDTRADNDDPYKSAEVNSRIIRTWTESGPGVAGFGNKTVTSPVVSLSEDNGDGELWDETPPDGTDFGGPLWYTNVLAGSFNPSIALYATPGLDVVTFTVDVNLMVNDLQFVGTAPDRWQMEVQNPVLTVETRVTYTYEIIPEPGGIVLLGLGSLLGVLKFRRRSS